MTTLTFQLSRALSREWSTSDTVVVTQLDHDANVSPWRLAAADRGAQLRTVRVNPIDATLDLEDFAAALESRPRLVALTAASNSVGTRTPIIDLIAMARMRRGLRSMSMRCIMLPCANRCQGLAS